MLRNKFIGWSALVLFGIAVAIIVLLVFSPLLERYNILNGDAAILAVGVLAFTAAVLGFCAFKTPQGKVAAVSGLVLLLAVAFFVPVAVTSTRGQDEGDSQPPPKVQPVKRVK